MSIDGSVVGQTVVDDVREVVDIKTARSDVGRHKQRQNAVAEFLHHHVALLLREVAVEGVGVISVGDELVGDFLGVAARAAEDDGVDIGGIVGDTLEGKVFVARVHHIVYVSHVLGAGVTRADDYLLRILHEALGNLRHLGGHRSREHQHRAVLGYMREDIDNRIDKAHVEHLVSLVEHHRMDTSEMYHSAVDEVDQTPRSSDYNLYSATQSPYLALDAAAAVHGQHDNFGHIF